MKTNNKRDVRSAFVRLVSHPFLQGGAGSAHIWRRVWDPGCAFLRQSWSQWVSCHYWLPEGGGKKDGGCSICPCAEIGCGIGYRGQDSLPVCFGRGFHLAGPCVSLWCACHSLSLECYWRGWCHRRQIGGAILWECMALMWRGWSHWLEEMCQHPDTTQMEISCAATETETTSVRRGSIWLHTDVWKTTKSGGSRRIITHNYLGEFWQKVIDGGWEVKEAVTVTDQTVLGGSHTAKIVKHSTCVQSFLECDLWKNSKHDEI